MYFRNTATNYGLIAKFFHWLVFGLFTWQFVLAELMEDAPKGEEKWALYAQHKSIGMLILFIVFLRIAWRMGNTPPAMEDSISKGIQKIAKLTHWFLYVVMLVMPISGYLMSMAGGHKFSFFGFFAVPDLVGLNKTLGGMAHETHEILACVIFIVVGVHIAGALYHHFILKDRTLRRMTR